jgi:hypothetical protein
VSVTSAASSDAGQLRRLVASRRSVPINEGVSDPRCLLIGGGLLSAPCVEHRFVCRIAP